jgi:hypothetical protein
MAVGRVALLRILVERFLLDFSLAAAWGSLGFLRD